MSKLSDPSLRYVVYGNVVSRTLEFLRHAGADGNEGVVLWPGKLEGNRCVTTEPLFPAQEGGPVFYDIPDEEVLRILRFVYDRELVIPIQVHSHPKSAYHSCADNERAFVQNENGI